jgi:hypothetical protein
MHSPTHADFWVRTPAPARAALMATLVVLGVGLASFLAILWVASASSGLSPVTVIFGPGQGMPLIVWLGTVLSAAVLQGLVWLTLRQRPALLRAIGAAAAFAIAAICLAFIVLAALSLVDYLTTGRLPGDILDLLVILFFGVPLGLVIGGLNARACLLEVRELMR